ncbi:TPA: helix-turn-helix domain-containing protein, partial [Enterococcus faecium]
MIEEYIEKNILRQLFLCGQFYVNKEVNLEKLSNLLHVCKTTLLNDINNIKKEFEEQIAYTHREKDRYTLYFSEHIPRCKIMQQLSQNSLFLKTCLLYLEEDEPDYLQLTECEFISVSKAYSLKKQVLAYFNDCGIEIDRYSPRFTEMERRLLLLNVSYRLGGFNSWELPESFFERADRFIESVTENSGRFYDKENKEILSIGFAISFLRQQVCAVTIDSKFIEEIKKRPIYNYVESAWENTDFQTYYKKEEFAFILTLFNLCNYGFHSYQLIAEDFQQLHQVFIDNTPEIKELVATFESHFNQELFGNQPFER